MARKLSKKIEGNDVIISVLGIEGDMTFDSSALSEEIRARLVPFGLGHKLGDSAAGAKTPEEAKTAIQRVWDGMVAGNWKTRLPAEEGAEKAPKISQKTILANLEKLPPEQQEAARSLLAAMGFSLPEPGSDVEPEVAVEAPVE